MIFGVLIMVFSTVLLAVYWKWVQVYIHNKYDQLFYLYLSIPFVPLIGLAMAALVVYVLSALGFMCGYFGGAQC